MKKLVLTAAIGAASLGLAACGDRTVETNNAAAAGGETEGNATAEGGSEGNAAGESGSTWAQDARIVEENGVTYRVDADGTRVRLGENDSRIVVENGVRYRVDPDGTRVRIDPRGARIDVDLPDVDVGVNEKGNLDVDVGDRDPDGGR